MKKLLPFIVAVAAIVCLTGCNSHFASTEMEIQGACWNASDTLTLAFENQDTSKVFQLKFPLTLTDDYPFHNIYLHASLQSPSGDKTDLPTEFILADRTGAWLTEPNGDLVPFQLTAAEGLRFNQVGKYTIRMYHYMRDLELCGVESAGIVLDPVES